MLRKIFVSFWLTVVVAGLAFHGASTALHQAELRSNEREQRLVAAAREAAEAWERGDKARAAVTMAAINRALGTNANVLDARGQSILGIPPGAAERGFVGTVARFFARGVHGVVGDSGVQLVGETFESTGAARYTVVTPARRNPFFWLATSRQSTDLVLGVILILSGVACFVLARHFAAPLTQLGAAANAVADGRLETRVSERIGARRDEVGTLARDFNRMAERIEALVAGQRRLLGDVSHELRSPLARLTVALTLARRQPDPAEYLDRIELEAQRLDLLVGQLLLLARIESGVEIARSEVDLTAIVQEVVSDGDFEARASERAVVLEEADACTITGNPDLLRSAIENIVRNAIRHTAAGTEVAVMLRTTSDSVTVTVRDHGGGLAEEILDHLFEPFRSASGGAGLGLAIAERVVHMHGGSAEASNAADGGVAVRITLPLLLSSHEGESGRG
ncbi:MAG TPA: ATP-binding protein [Thermoanaerobaculia bacterium]|nr:ATP-binding protein [Thermoanaerobaculia bacterium]